MRAAFVAMSILGCDEQGSHCHPVATLAERWPTIAACDAASETMLSKYENVAFPMVVAVCQTAETSSLEDGQDDVAENAADQHPGLTSRAISLFKSVIPSRKALVDTVSAPVHFVSDSYSWVARKITD
jgi:hypothetical protein